MNSSPNPYLLQNFIDHSADFLHLTQVVGVNNAFMVLTALVLHQGSESSMV
jgi:hypothetical protein